ncbi:MAG: hypothetical protein COA71_04770 [SAR86 cluster bacterium]|uniref:OB-fold nucleic acid binding domain-containing protein n=1 Tax=SAR86 cluster bacterium TaxID=2030880 RepID=A0A2A5CG14_9GAMM|nr:MAG: hypothetical protein COA71_04770 [SAR86 cluster bacterium]
MKNKLILLFSILTALLGSTALNAHHNFRAEFDIDMPVIVTGTVMRLALTNPHARLYVDVVDESGEITHWNFELAAASSLLRRGWRRDTLVVGNTVIVHAARARNAPNVGNVEYVTLVNEDGSEGFSFGSPRE